MRAHRLRWLGIFGLGVALRLVLWSGYGLGDDPNYFSAYYSVLQRGTFDPADPYQMRFGIWAPVVVAMKILGVTEAGFVGAITFYSILNLVLVYLLARQEWDRSSALLAMLLLAVFPLDILCAGLFANDVFLATYCFTALWLFRRSLRDDVGLAGRLISAVATGLFLLFAFVTKPWVTLVLPLLVVEGLRRFPARPGSVLLAAGATLACVGSCVAWQQARFGDPLYHVNVSRGFAIFVPYSRDILLDYPRMLFQRNDYGAYFAGYYPQVLCTLALLYVRRLASAGKWLAYTLVILVGLTALPAGKEHGHWVTLVPHIFRYLALVSIPLCLALTAYLRVVFQRRWEVGAVFTTGFVLVSVAQAIAVTEPTRDTFAEQRRAIAALRAYPDARIWSDGGFGSRFIYFELHQTRLGRFAGIRSENPAGRAQEYGAIRDGIVVTGGARNPWYNCFPCHANLDGFAPPPSWTLLDTFAARPAPYRLEPLRIWRVSSAARSAQALLRERPEPAARQALLDDLLARRNWALAVEVGEQVLAEPPAEGRARVEYATGRGCFEAGRPACAEEHLVAALTGDLTPAEIREAMTMLALATERRGDYEAARAWARELGKRFPEAPVDPQLAEIESGMSEAVRSYQERRLGPARRLFATIANDPDANADRRKRAQYFLALTLFGLRQIDDAVRQMDAYRQAYGEDPYWLELHYRHAQALAPGDPRGDGDLPRPHDPVPGNPMGERGPAADPDGARRHALTVGLGVVLALHLAHLAVVAWRLPVDYWDGYEYLMNARTLAGDEIARRDYGYSEIRPPLVPLLLLPVLRWYAPAGGGTALWGPHLVAFALGVFALAAVYWLLRQTVAGTAALAGCLLLAINPLFAHYVPFVMTDIPVMLFVTVGAVAYLRARETGRWRWYALAAAGLAAALLAKYTAGTILGALALFEVLRVVAGRTAGGFRQGLRRLLTDVRPWLVVVGAVAGMGLVEAGVAIRVAPGANPVTRLTDLFRAQFLAGVGHYVTDAWFEFGAEFAAAFSPALVAVAGLGALAAARRRSDADLLCLAWFVVVAGALALLAGHLEARYGLPVVPPLVYFMVTGLGTLRTVTRAVVERLGGSAAAAARLWALGLAALMVKPALLGAREIRRFHDPVYTRPFLPTMARWLLDRTAPGQRVFVGKGFIYTMYPADPFLSWYDEFFHFHHISTFTLWYLLDRPLELTDPVLEVNDGVLAALVEQFGPTEREVIVSSDNRYVDTFAVSVPGFRFEPPDPLTLTAVGRRTLWRVDGAELDRVGYQSAEGPERRMILARDGATWTPAEGLPGPRWHVFQRASALASPVPFPETGVPEPPRLIELVATEQRQMRFR